jgi:cell division protein FtsX
MKLPRAAWAKALIFATAVALLGGAAAWYWFGASPVVPLRTAPVQRGDLVATVSATGTVEPEEVVDVGAQVVGMIKEFGPDSRDSRRTIDYLSEVEVGTVLACIDDAVYRARLDRAAAAVEQAAAQVEQARASLQRAEADVAQMQGRFQQADRDWARAQRLMPTRSISVEEYDAAQAAFTVAAANLRSAEAAVDQILVKAPSPQAIPGSVRQITELLRERHRIRAGQEDDFSVRDLAEMTRTLEPTSQLMGSLLLAMALISLLVGGVGIMNIMLVSVTERTREIGLRMAVGAPPRMILRQFLVEAVVLCLLGGALGVAGGRGCSLLVRLLLHWPTEWSLPAVAAVGVSVSVGLLFGYYPAWKASRSDPIVALRYE